MRVVVDTNVVVSGVFFGGAPRRVVEAVVDSEIEASATSEIVDEYSRVVERMIERKGGRLRGDAFSVLVSKLEVIEAVTRVEACRDPDDDKFIGCALDARAIYIVSGDRDLLDMGSYQGVEMVTAAEASSAPKASTWAARPECICSNCCSPRCSCHRPAETPPNPGWTLLCCRCPHESQEHYVRRVRAAACRKRSR